MAKMLRIDNGKMTRELDSVGADADIFAFPASAALMSRTAVSMTNSGKYSFRLVERCLSVRVF